MVNPVSDAVRAVLERSVSSRQSQTERGQTYNVNQLQFRIYVHPISGTDTESLVLPITELIFRQDRQEGVMKSEVLIVESSIGEVIFQDPVDNVVRNIVMLSELVQALERLVGRNEDRHILLLIVQKLGEFGVVLDMLVETGGMLRRLDDLEEGGVRVRAMWIVERRFVVMVVVLMTVIGMLAVIAVVVMVAIMIMMFMAVAMMLVVVPIMLMIVSQNRLGLSGPQKWLPLRDINEREFSRSLHFFGVVGLKFRTADDGGLKQCI